MRFRIWIYVCFFLSPLSFRYLTNPQIAALPRTEGTNIMREKSECFLCDLYASTAGQGEVWARGRGGGRVSLYSCHCSAAPVGPSLRWQLNTFIKHVKSTRGREWEAQAMQCVATTRHQVAPVRVNFSHPLTGWWTAQFKSHITHTFINKHTIDARENCG